MSIDMKTLADNMVSATREFVARSLAPRDARLKALEECAAALEARLKALEERPQLRALK